MIVLLRLAAVVAFATTLTGCAGSVSHWIVDTRNRQGDSALAHGNLKDASAGYELALKIDPKNTHAIAGLTSVQLRIAQNAFADGKLEDALAALAQAPKNNPQADAVADVRTNIEQARIKREIVLSNYPAYKETGYQIRRSYAQLRTLNNDIIKSMQRFAYTYDTNELAKAIRGSYALQAELVKNTDRLVAFRQLVESGSPERRRATDALAPPSSLLPLP